VDQPLAHLRFRAELSRGRRYPEPAHPYRKELQRDRDRIVHARAFRRLEDKTQVFGSGLSDHFRNRLTHTIEVSQIARTVAAALGLDEEFTEALALGHDIGHPPFAHAGEAELDRLMARYGEGFDHNLHALRIVERFERRYARFPGLNLTFEVREGIVKHSRDFAPGESPLLDEYLPGVRPPLEAQLIDLCDEIAYNTADLDDSHAAGMLDPERVCAASPGFAALWESAQTMCAGVSERIQLFEVVRGLIDRLVTGLLEGTVAACHDAGLAAADATVEQVRRHPVRLARFTPEVAELNAQIKSFLRAEVYRSPRLEEARRHSTAKLAALFDYFLEHPGEMPAPDPQEAAAEPLHRRVCDHLAGMTDGYLNRTYAAVFGPTPNQSP
jgi:dGTPase